MSTAPLRLAVVGAGWAGLAAAVAAFEHLPAGALRLALYDTATQAGGRARSIDDGQGRPAERLDNGQHIFIGAYRQTLALMRTVGVDVARALDRRPLELRHADGGGLVLPRGHAALAFARGVWRCRDWRAHERLSLLAHGARWALAGFRCSPDVSVDRLCERLPAAVRRRLIEPLCIAALNTRANEASAAVFLRVLQDGLFGGPDASDLLLPQAPLAALLPEPALGWLAGRGALLRLGRRVRLLERAGAASGAPNPWLLDGEPFDAVVLACGATEAARLAAPHAAGWARTARTLRFEPIVTAYVRHPAARLDAPMLALDDGPEHPAQFVFDHGALGGVRGRFAFVASGAARWVERGLPATAGAVLTQAAAQLPRAAWPAAGATIERMIAERRATFACTPALERPAMHIAPGLFAAGDHIDGPYPATLEGAVRSGRAAAAAACGARHGRSQ